jgi:hypothetical protein
MFVVNVNYLSGELVLPTNKTDRHDIAKMLLKVALSTIQCNTKPINYLSFRHSISTGKSGEKE